MGQQTKMTSHPNRSKRNPKLFHTPTPAQIRAAREAAGLSRSEAASKIGSTTRAWENYEADPEAVNSRRMQPGLFVLFQLVTGQLDLADVRQALK